MTSPIILLLIILAVALVLFSIEAISVDIIALSVLLSLVVCGLIPVESVFAGFGNDTIGLIVGLLILTAALVRTGVVDYIGRKILQMIGSSSGHVNLAVMFAVASLSSFMSNTAATALFIPVVMGLSRKLRVSASKLLMPLAFSAILASSVTLVGTSTNIVVSGLLTTYGLPPIGMFELAPVGIPILIVGFIYMAFIGLKLIPERNAPEVLTEEFGLEPYLTEIVVLPNSSLIGKSLQEAALGQNLDLTVVVVIRGRQRFFVPNAEVILQSGDVLVVEGKKDDILRVKETSGIDINTQMDIIEPEVMKYEMQLAEVIILLRSPMIGRTLRGMNFREKYRVQVLAIQRHEATILHKINQVIFRLGDVLLVQGSPHDFTNLERNNIFRVIGTVEESKQQYRRGRIAFGIFVTAILIAAFNIVTLPLAILIGTVLAFLTRCITPEEAYREVEWKIVILIGCMLAFGTAMEYTGTARYLATTLVGLLGKFNPIWLLSGFFVLSLLLTQPMSNQAAAVVVLPIAIQTAMQLGLNPRTFAVMIALGASTSFITPLEPACLMVYGLGHYRFMDFLRVGFLLTVVIFLVAILLVPIIWPL
jgi:di/tricarboxylate transporter